MPEANQNDFVELTADIARALEAQIEAEQNGFIRECLRRALYSTRRARMSAMQSLHGLDGEDRS